MRLQSWELGLRPRYVSAAALSRPSPLLATAYAMLFRLHGSRRSLPVARACSPLRPLRRCPFQNMKRARQEFVQASRGQALKWLAGCRLTNQQQPWRLDPQRAASANDDTSRARIRSLGWLLAAHGQRAAMVVMVVATDAQPRWPWSRAYERGKRGHHQTPFVSCTTGTIKTSLTTAPHLRLTVGTSVEERVCR